MHTSKSFYRQFREVSAFSNNRAQFIHFTRQGYCLNRLHSYAKNDDDDAEVSKTQSTTNRSAGGLYLPSHPNTPITSIMAPMVAASDYPFRWQCRDHGVQLTYTQMLHSKNFVTDAKFRQTHLDLWETGAVYPDLLPAQIDCLNGGRTSTAGRIPRNGVSLREADRSGPPLMVQLAGHDADIVVKAALMIYEHTNGKLTGVDLNCGCPQGIAKKGNYGAFLMERDADTVYEILRALRAHLPPTVAVSAKIRLPLDDRELEDRICRLVDTGVHFLTIHGRTLWENKTKVGTCAVDRIRLAVETAHKINPHFPIVANGGMEDYGDIQRILQTTGAAAAMSSEALLETPDLFRKESLDVVTPQDRFQRQASFAKEYLDKCAIAPPVPGVLGVFGSINVVRGHLFKYLHRYLQEQPDVRERLAANDGGRDMRSLDQARTLVEELEERYSKLSDEEWLLAPSSNLDATWYRRHRKPDRKVHQKEIRGLDSGYATSLTSLDDRKREIKVRIQQVKAQRLERLERENPSIAGLASKPPKEQKISSR